MRISKTHVLIETTHRAHGCLEQGGVAGRVQAYPLDAVIRVTGLTADQLAEVDADDDAPGYMAVSIRELIEHRLGDQARVIRRGYRIQ